MSGALIAFEGIDQAGKMTQVQRLGRRLHDLGLPHTHLQYPDYETPIGKILAAALRGDLELPSRARTMLFAANRWERDADLRKRHAEGEILLVDRYSWSNVVYGTAQGYPESWLRGLERDLLQADLTFFIDITPKESLRRKSRERDRFERDLELLERARQNYQRLARELAWLVVDGEGEPANIARSIEIELKRALSSRLPKLAALAE